MIDHFEPDIITAQDYYPFGMISRTEMQHTDKPYKFGFNGKLNDNDVKGGLGLQQDYGMRIYDSRVGRFLSVDPITKKYPELTPYQFSSNSPIAMIDIDGLEGTWYKWDDALTADEKDAAHHELERTGKKGVGAAALVAAAVVDAYVTKGWLSRGVLLYFFADAAEHNRAKTPEGRAEQDKRSRTQIANGLIWEGSGLILGGVVRGIKLFEPRHIDIGGYGGYPNADNYTLSPVDYNGNPIPNLSLGYAEFNLKNVPSNSIDIITIENAPFGDAIMTEASRVLKPKGTLEITTNASVVGPETFPDIAKKHNLTLKEIKKTYPLDETGKPFEQQTAVYNKPSMAK